VRINIHYTYDKNDIDFLAKAIAFAARQGSLFLREYEFDWRTGEWRHLGFQEKKPDLTLENKFRTPTADLSRKGSLRAGYFREALRLAKKLETTAAVDYPKDAAEIEGLKYFYYIHSS
jgi:hypothetical protein